MWFCLMALLVVRPTAAYEVCADDAEDWRSMHTSSSTPSLFGRLRQLAGFGGGPWVSQGCSPTERYYFDPSLVDKSECSPLADSVRGAVQIPSRVEHCVSLREGKRYIFSNSVPGCRPTTSTSRPAATHRARGPSRSSCRCAPRTRRSSPRSRRGAPSASRPTASRSSTPHGRYS